MTNLHRLEVDQPLDAVLNERSDGEALLSEEKNAGPNFFRGLLIGLAISLFVYVMVFQVFF